MSPQDDCVDDAESWGPGAARRGTGTEPDHESHVASTEPHLWRLAELPSLAWFGTVRRYPGDATLIQTLSKA